MVQQKDVRYAKLGGPNVQRESSSSGRIFIVIVFAMVAILFLSLGRNTSKSSINFDDNAISGQAHHTTTTVTGSTASIVGAGDSDMPGTSYSSSSYEQEPQPKQPPPPQYEDEEDGEDDGFGKSSSSGGKSVSSTSSYNEEASGDDDVDEEGSDEEEESSSGSQSDDEEPGEDGKFIQSNGYSSSNDYHSGVSSSYSDIKDEDSASPKVEESKMGAGAAEGSGDGDSDGPDESEADRAERQVVHDLRQVEQEEIKQEEVKVESTLSKFGGALRIGLGKLFGDKVSTEEIEEIAEKVEKDVATEVDTEFQAEATSLLNEAVENVDEEVREAEDVGTEDEEIAQELISEEKGELETMRHSMQEIEDRVEGNIQTRIDIVKKKVLEERLSKKLGRDVKLTFVDSSEGRGYGGLDEALKDLPSLRGSTPGSTPAKKKRKKHKMSSSSYPGGN